MFQAQAKKWSSQQRERKEVSGAPGEIRTPDPLVRSQMLYPAELRAREAILPKIAGGAVGCGFRSRRREGTVGLQFRSAAIRRIAAARRGRLGCAWVDDRVRECGRRLCKNRGKQQKVEDGRNMVGLGRLELPTSPLSGVRSSHLSYRPNLLAGNILRDLRRSSNNGGASVAQLARVIRTADERGRTAVATGTVRLTRRAIIRKL
jgi:hypothetical protein